MSSTEKCTLLGYFLLDDQIRPLRKFPLSYIVEIEQIANMGQTRQPVTMREPACAMACKVCLLECAVLPDRLAWWSGELERLRRERVPLSSPRWHEWRDHLRACEAACEALTRQIEATRSMATLPGAHAAHLQAFAPVPLH